MDTSDPSSDFVSDRPIVRVLAPDARRLSAAEVRAMLGGAESGQTPGLDRGRQMVAVCGDEPIGVAAFELDDLELRVHALVVPEGEARALPALLGALELACLAAGGARVAVTPSSSGDVQVWSRCGYVPATRRAGGLVKQLVP
jgi:hypothetical protein